MKKAKAKTVRAAPAAAVTNTIVNLIQREHAISLAVGRQVAALTLCLPEEQRPLFLLGWAACAEAIRRLR